MRSALLLFALAAASPTVAGKGEQQDSPNTLTHGMVQMTLKMGQTSQSEVFEAFGAPNITMIDGQGQEVWVYDRHATVAVNSSSSFSIGLLFGGVGAGVGGGAGTGFGKSKSKSEQGSRTMTLVIKFDGTKKVVDFKSRSSSF